MEIGLGTLMFEAADIAIAGDGQHELMHCAVFQDTVVVIREIIVHTIQARSTFEEFCHPGDNVV